MGNQTEIRHTIGATGTLVLRLVSGNIKLAGSDADEAIVHASGDHGWTPDLNVVRTPGMLVVELRKEGMSFFRGRDASINLDVSVPRGARVEVRSVSADVVAAGLIGEQEYKSVSGDIHLSGAAGRLSVQSVSGDLHINGGKRLELAVTTTSGDVHLDAQLVDYLRAKTVSGDVRMTGRLADGPRHAVETVSGDLVLRSTGGVTVEPSRALDIGRSSRRATVIGNGAAILSFRSMSGEERVSGTAETLSTPVPPTPPTPPTMPTAPSPPEPPTAIYRTTPRPMTRLDVLRALERGEIDVEEAARQLEEVTVDA